MDGLNSEYKPNENTAPETQQIIAAWKIICRKARYREYITSKPDAFSKSLILALDSQDRKAIEQHVEFLNQENFRKVTARFPHLSGCMVAGITITSDISQTQKKKDMPGRTQVVQAKTKYMYINRQFKRPTTVVHEMFHYFTHDNFVDAFKVAHPGIDEAITEYFTRKVLSPHNNNEKEEQKETEFFLKERKGSYDLHHKYLLDRRNEITGKNSGQSGTNMRGGGRVNQNFIANQIDSGDKRSPFNLKTLQGAGSSSGNARPITSFGAPEGYMKNYLKEAYFLGNPAAIKFILENFKIIEEKLKKINDQLK